MGSDGLHTFCRLPSLCCLDSSPRYHRWECDAVHRVREGNGPSVRSARSWARPGPGATVCDATSVGGDGEPVGFQKSAYTADPGARCARPAGMIASRVVAAALPDLPQAVEPAVVARSLVGVSLKDVELLVLRHEVMVLRRHRLVTPRTICAGRDCCIEGRRRSA